MLQPPAANQLPAYPASWYLFGRSGELRGGPVSKEFFGRLLVAFRDGDGRAAVLEGRCAHLGADLGQAGVAGGKLRCPLHGWEYGPDGRCRLPAAAAGARLRRYPAVERHGLLFFFNGPRPLFPLPFFAGEDSADFVAGRPLRFVGDCPWYMVNANSFDVQHFQAAHNRQVVGPVVVDCPAPFARRIRLTFAVSGHSVFDRLLRRHAGSRVEVSMTNWGGSIVVVTGFFRRAHSYLTTFIQPLGPDRCVQNVIVFARRGRHRLAGAILEPVSLWVRRLFTQAFMADEFDTLAGIRYNPGGLLPCDAPMIDFFRWVSELPSPTEGAWEDGPSTGGPGLEGDPQPAETPSLCEDTRS